MRSFTMVLPLLAFLAALSQGLFQGGGAYDAGADPQAVVIMTARYKVWEARRAQQARRDWTKSSSPLRLARP